MRLFLVVSLFVFSTVLFHGLKAEAQGLVVDVVPSVDGVAAEVRSFGARAGASDGVDPFDQPEPPAAPGACPLLAMVIPGADLPLPNLWRCDIRDLSTLLDVGLALWDAPVCVAEAPAVLRLDFTATSDLPAGFFLLVHRDGQTAEVPVPGALELDLEGTEESLLFEIVLEGGVEVSARNWSAVRDWYR